MTNTFLYKNGDVLQMKQNPEVKRVVLQARKTSCLWFYPDTPPLNEGDLISKVYDSRNSNNETLFGWDKIGKYDLSEIRKVLGKKDLHNGS